MSRRKKIHLFNCDHLYELRVIEDLLYSCKPKLGFDFTVENHYFSFSEMAELSEKIVPALKIDFAVFVVHAQESSLSINDGRGYTKLYKALLQATGGNVIIVIGGDDNYKNEDKEKRSVISVWARRAMSVQFSEEYLDGRKSFIFSWGEKHRPIHEDALKHFFDPGRNGERFIYQLPTQRDPSLQPGRVKPVGSITSGCSGNEPVILPSGGTESAAEIEPITPAEAIPVEVEEEKCPLDSQEKDETGSSVVHSSDVEDAHTEHDPLKAKLVLKSKLHNGKVSFDPDDVVFLSPEFLKIPDVVTQSLLETYRHTDEIQLRVISVENEFFVYTGDQGIEMADNDLLLLKSRVRKGVVSFHEDDVKFRYSGWKVPEYILQDLKRNASTGKLFIVSDEKGSLRCIIQNKAKRRAKSAKGRVLAFSTSENYLNISF
ncbi:uncharacterized protein [Porites lutea]|uniref:uncharacterized protein n=1 Tax=Porites lutea TaxID=51062 RepID=UPI003CC58C81